MCYTESCIYYLNLRVTLLKHLRIINTLNIDTALGAVSFVFIVSSVRKVEVDIAIYLALIVSVLSIYNLDHLIDAYWLKETKSSFRHLFYQKYFKVLLVWQFLVLVAGVWLLFQLPLAVIYAGIAMGAAIGLYFLIIFNTRYKNYLLREVIIAAGYTFSVAVIPFTASQNMPKLDFYGILLIIFLIALTNLWVFAVYDYEVDKAQNHHSIAMSVANKNLAKMARAVVGLLLVIIGMYMLYFQFWILGMSLIAVELIYLMLLTNQSFYRKNEYYRIVGESILILPSLVLLAAYAI